jgi:hypothetical protein
MVKKMIQLRMVCFFSGVSICLGGIEIPGGGRACIMGSGMLGSPVPSGSSDVACPVMAGTSAISTVVLFLVGRLARVGFAPPADLALLFLGALAGLLFRAISVAAVVTAVLFLATIALLWVTTKIKFPFG